MCSLFSRTHADEIDFNRDIRPILSNHCFQCHGPDAKKRKAGLRLDTSEGAREDLDGSIAVVPGKPAESELLARVRAEDPDDRMPPSDKGDPLSARDIALLERWIASGAEYAPHWSYTTPKRPALPKVTQKDWPRGEVDHFLLARLEREKLSPSPEADRETLARRAALDLTGLPPSPEEVAAFLADKSTNTFERYVDRLLAKSSFGEHWARMWLDLARYADSAGYADDPPRTIWGYRDYVIRSFNENKPFDEFTVEQIAGDLLVSPSNEQLVATAFHRNTLTNNEGGTNDEEFRNVAVVDRVNTTLEVWMATTMACAQCHTHKYDPITQEEYFRFFAIFNNTEDADRRNESPTTPVYTKQQREDEAKWKQEIATFKKTLSTPTPALLESQKRWEEKLSEPATFDVIAPTAAKLESGREAKTLDDSSVLVAGTAKTDVYEISFEQEEKARSISALQLEVLPDDSLPSKGPGQSGGNFVLSRVRATITPPGDARLRGRFVRVDLPGNDKMLSLAEVEAFSGADNVARGKNATQSSTGFGGPANLAVDGNTNGDYNVAKSTTHTLSSPNPWWEVDLGEETAIDRVVLWNRTDNNLQSRLAGYRLSVLDKDRKPVFEKTDPGFPKREVAHALSGTRGIPFAVALADHEQKDFAASNVIDPGGDKNRGWAVGGGIGKKHTLTLIPKAAVELGPGAKLTLRLEQQSKHENHTIGRLRVLTSSSSNALDFARLPEKIRGLVQIAAKDRNDAQRAELTNHFLANVASELDGTRKQLAEVEMKLSSLKPATTVPIFRELAKNRRRKTHIQLRGNFLDKGKEVTAGLPAVFTRNKAENDDEFPSRLDVARWLVDENNPLTARVIANRFWEKIFGIGIVRTSEEFGSQGELPSHPALLDWLATELVRSDWNVKKFLKILVTSAAYRQSSKVTPELFARDPQNRLLARGPRFRLSAEMVRDQALFVGGLLSPKLYGPSVNPPQPKLGVSAAFGSGIDWKTSGGEDRYRRGLYTRWRRSNPYPSMAAFDAPNREVCTVRRDRTNTPIQALVTLNDEVYIEAAQALSRRIETHEGDTAAKIRYAYRLGLARDPTQPEIDRLAKLFDLAHDKFSKEPALAMDMATKPLGKAPEGADVARLAAWTVVGNVLLNLDEMLMKR